MQNDVETVDLRALEDGIEIVVGSPECVHFITVKMVDGEIRIEDISDCVYHDRLKVYKKGERTWQV